MLTLVNTNRMIPPIAPVGLDYMAAAARRAGVDVEMVDLCLADDPVEVLRQYFAHRQPELVGLTFRNVDDCFWPSAQSFLPELNDTLEHLRKLTDSPLLLGGVGYSIFPRRLLEETGADFGIHGDGEAAIVALLRQLRGLRSFDQVAGLVFANRFDHRRQVVFIAGAEQVEVGRLPVPVVVVSFIAALVGSSGCSEQRTQQKADRNLILQGSHPTAGRY